MGLKVGQERIALLAVIYRSGRRVSEALQLQPRDLDLDGGAIRVLFAKGGRARMVGIDAGDGPCQRGPV